MVQTKVMVKILFGGADTQTVLGAKGISSSCKFPIFYVCQNYEIWLHLVDKAIQQMGLHFGPLCILMRLSFVSFYRAMHYSAKRGIAIACRLSVCLSVTFVI